MSFIYNNAIAGSSGNQGGAAGYQVSRSIRLNPSDSAFLSRTPASAGNRKTWTWSGWVKRSDLTNQQTVWSAGSTGTNRSSVLFQGGGQIRFFNYAGSVDVDIVSTPVYRDASAWYHFVVSVDTTQATSTNRFKLYVNGDQVTVFSTATYPSLNQDLVFNSAIAHGIGRGEQSGGEYFSGYLADIHFIDGQALTPSSFAETNATTGQWVPKAYTGSYGTNGFRLDFSNPFDLGNDAAGANDWTPNNLSGVSGGPTSVAAASGALPVYNTTDTYGTTKGTGTRTDANASSLVLAIPMDGTNNGTTFTDESATIKGSGSAKSITRNGDTKTVTAQSKYYGSSGYFDGSGDYLTLTANADFGFGSGTAFTIETWIYGSNLGSTPAVFGNREYVQSNSFTVYASSSSTNTLQIHVGGGTVTYFNVPGGLPNDRWHHIAMTRNTSNTVTFYVNGVSVGTGSPAADLSNTNFYIGCWGSGRGAFFQGYIQDFRVYKGVAEYTSNFNPPSSTQNPTVAAGNDSLVDTPTSYGTDTGAGGQVRGNYCTWNPLDNAGPVLANGNLDASRSTASWSGSGCRATLGVTSGKWYWEITQTSATSGSANNHTGISKQAATLNNYLGSDANGWAYDGVNGFKLNNGSGTSYGATWTTNDVIGVAFDADAGTLTFYKNGVSQGQAFSGLTSGPYFPTVSLYGTISCVANFGQRPFAYTAPSGFKALCDTNLPAPTIAKPSTVFDVKLYTGNGSTQTINGLGFSPDLVWVKQRTSGASHVLVDTVRGAFKLSPNQTIAEVAGGAFYGSVSPTSDGFSLVQGSDTDPSYGGFWEVGANAKAYAAWAWDAGSSTVTNTSGSISSQVRANASAGFSVCTFSLTTANSISTFGHGLGVSPEFVIIKPRNTSTDWAVFHNASGASPLQARMLLNSTAARTTYGFDVWSRSSTTLGVYSTILAAPGTAIDCVAYCFAPVAGYSAFGSYTGNGSTTDNTFVYTGMRPRFVMLKRSDSTGNWVVWDAARNSYNVANSILLPNTSAAEYSPDAKIDILSNGFKVRDNSSDSGTNGAIYIYAAFAENPFQYARAR